MSKFGSTTRCLSTHGHEVTFFFSIDPLISEAREGVIVSISIDFHLSTDLSPLQLTVCLYMMRRRTDRKSESSDFENHDTSESDDICLSLLSDAVDFRCPGRVVCGWGILALRPPACSQCANIPHSSHHSSLAAAGLICVKIPSQRIVRRCRAHSVDVSSQIPGSHRE